MQKLNRCLLDFYDDWQTRIKRYKVIKKCLEDYFNSNERVDGKPSAKELLTLFKTNPQYYKHAITAKGPDYEDIHFYMDKHKIDENESIETLDINVLTNGYKPLFSINIHWDDNGNFYVWNFDFDGLDSLSWSKFHHYLTCLFYNGYNKSEDAE